MFCMFSTPNDEVAECRGPRVVRREDWEGNWQQ